MTLISAPSAQTASTGLPATSDAAEAGSFASVLEGVLQADASARVPIRAEGATGGRDLSASATAVALMGWPSGQSAPDGTSGQAETEVPGTTDANAPANAPAIVAGAVIEGTATALSIAPNSAAPTAEAGPTAETTPPTAPAMSPAPFPSTPASPGVDDGELAGAPAGDDTGLDTASRTRATETVATTPPIANPATAAPSPSVPSASVQNPSAPGTAAPDADLQTSQPAAAVPGPVPATPAPIGTRGATPGAITPTEAQTSVRAPALGGSQPAAAEAAAPAAVPPVSSPMPTAPAATTASPSAPAASPAPPLNTQLAQPLFSLAGARTGEHVMTVQVTPDNLGPVTVRAVIGGDDIRIELFSPSDGGRDALRQILTDLRRDLAGGGLAASLDLSSKNEPGSSEERTPLREAPRSGAAAPEPVIEQRSDPASTATTTLDVTV